MKKTIIISSIILIITILLGIPLEKSEMHRCTITGSSKYRTTYLGLFSEEYSIKKSRLENFLIKHKIPYKYNWKFTHDRTKYSNFGVARGCSRMPKIVNQPYLEVLIEENEPKLIKELIPILTRKNEIDIENKLSEINQYIETTYINDSSQ